jgi:hypothetical protein
MNPGGTPLLLFKIFAGTCLLMSTTQGNYAWTEFLKIIICMSFQKEKEKNNSNP